MSESLRSKLSPFSLPQTQKRHYAQAVEETNKGVVSSPFNNDYMALKN